MTLFRKIVLSLVPNAWELPLRYWHKRLTGALDFELSVLADFVDPGKRAIDVGANVGIYSYALARLGVAVESFEPMAECASVIAAFGHPRINVHPIALSNAEGTMTIQFPVVDGRPTLGYASLEHGALDGGTRDVRARRLDDLGFSDVGFIKIDVEGHEYRVIEGAIETLRRCRPVLLIEIEQRHHGNESIERGFNRICSQGYECGFFWNGNFLSLREFSANQHQKLEYLGTSRYANNFFFRPV